MAEKTRTKVHRKPSSKKSSTKRAVKKASKNEAPPPSQFWAKILKK